MLKLGNSKMPSLFESALALLRIGRHISPNLIHSRVWSSYKSLTELQMGREVVMGDKIVSSPMWPSTPSSGY